MRGRVHTAQPGEIVKIISSAPPIVNVQPAYARLREGADGPEPRPVIPNVPLIFPVFGEFGVTSEITVGATVLLIATERSIKSWMEQGRTVDPGMDRMFDLSDCIAIAGLPHKSTDWAVPQAGIQIGTTDGETTVSIVGGEVTIKTPDISASLTNILSVGGGGDYVALAQKVDDSIQAIVDAITDAVPVAQDGGAGLQTSLLVALNASLAAIGSVAATALKSD